MCVNVCVCVRPAYLPFLAEDSSGFLSYLLLTYKNLPQKTFLPNCPKPEQAFPYRFDTGETTEAIYSFVLKSGKVRVYYCNGVDADDKREIRMLEIDSDSLKLCVLCKKGAFA